MMDAPETDRQLGELFKDNAPEVDEEALRRRVATRGRQKKRKRRRAENVRLLVTACACVVVIAAVGYGTYTAAAHLLDRDLVVLTDSTDRATAPSGPTSTTGVAEASAVQAAVKTMTSAPLVLTAGGKTFTLAPDEIQAAIDYPVYSDQVPGMPVLSAAKLNAFFAGVAAAVEVAAVDATFAHDASRAWVVPGKEGVAVDETKTANALTLAARSAAGRTVAVVTKTTEPGLTTAEAQAMGITTALSTYSTAYSADQMRQSNVKLATRYATDVLLAPGQEFDFDHQVGPRTTARGWKLAPGITGPGQIDDVLGGGLTQVATTMFNAVAGGKAGLSITERHNHSLFIPHYPKGRDAAISSGSKDLRFVNDMKHYVWITGTSDGVTTTITVWGTDEGRSTSWSVGDFYDVQAMTETTVIKPNLKHSETSLVSNGQTGKSLKTTRVVSRDGEVIHDDVFVSLWPMVPKVIGVGK